MTYTITPNAQQLDLAATKPRTPVARRTRLRRLQLSVASLATASLLAACGGGGGGGATSEAGPAAPPPSAQPTTPGVPPASPPVSTPPTTPPPAQPAGALSAEEDLAWKSYVLRTIAMTSIDDGDESFAVPTAFDISSRQFKGLYPTGTGAGSAGQSNIPPAILDGGLCKDGGSSSTTNDDKNGNGRDDAGDSFTTIQTNCKDGVLNGNSTIKTEFYATSIYYAQPNQNAILSVKGIIGMSSAIYNSQIDNTLTIKGKIEFDIREADRIVLHKDYTLNLNGNTIISNLAFYINRSTRFGDGVPFSLTSISGTLSIDGITYQVGTSANTPWIKTPGYMPTSGTFSMTGPSGDQIITQFTNNGAICGIFPRGETTTPSLLVNKCSRL